MRRAKNASDRRLPVPPRTCPQTSMLCERAGGRGGGACLYVSGDHGRRLPLRRGLQLVGPRSAAALRRRGLPAAERRHSRVRTAEPPDILRRRGEGGPQLQERTCRIHIMLPLLCAGFQDCAPDPKLTLSRTPGAVWRSVQCTATPKVECQTAQMISNEESAHSKRQRSDIFH